MGEVASERVSLSMTAEWLLGASVAEAAPGADGVGAAACIAALLRYDREAAETAARDLGIDLHDETASGGAAVEGAAFGPISRQEVARRASEEARRDGRAVASVADVARAILTIGAEPRARPTPSDAAPSAPGRPSDGPSSTMPAVVTTDQPDIEAADGRPGSDAGGPGTEPERDERVVRVFISSTFRDMHEERDILVKRVFPELRRQCRARGVEFVEVDLRWGITREQAERGEVLPVCLAEIQLCRPYFIGLLGQRYGWVPSGIPADLARSQPWLDDGERSVTELEILHGALNDPSMAGHAFFYFRDPAYLGSIEPERAPDFQPEDAAASRKLEALKQRIRESGLPVRESYPDPRSLGELVLEDLRQAIDTEFPEGSAPDAWDRERAAHRTFARSRTRVFVQRPGDFDRLDAHTRGGGPPLVVTGPAGSGKSALVANWAIHHRSLRPEVQLVYHAVSATPQGADHIHLARRLAVELLPGGVARAATGGVSTTWVDALDDDDVPRTLASLLRSSTEDGRDIVLVLDGVDQLADAPGARELLWLPDDLPGGLHLVVTARPGVVLDAVARRGWSIEEIDPLDADARSDFAEQYLWSTYRKRLETTQLEQIAGAPQTASPLFLRALLEEIRIFGEFDLVGQRIEHYLAARSVLELFGLVLERLEADYESDCPGLVGNALAAIWASRRGLTEPELLAVTGSPMAAWSPLRLALEESLISRGGLLGLFHDELRRAVEERYLPEEPDRAAEHLLLAGFFEAADADARRAEELPFQLAEAGAWQRLAETLSDPVLTDTIWEAEPSTLRGYWTAVRDHTGITPPEAYAAALASPAEQPREPIWSIALLLSTMAYAAEALPIQRHLVERARAEGNGARIQASLGNLAVSLSQLGQLEDALECHREEETICRNYGMETDLQKCLANQVGLLDKLERPDEALRVLDEAEALCRRIGDPGQLAHRLHARAQLLSGKGDLDGARAALLEAGRLIESLADREDMGILAGGFNDQGVAHKNRGDLEQAMACYREAERISRMLGLASTLQASLGNQANVLGRRHEYEAADRLFAEAETICRRVADRDSLMRCLFNRAYRLIEAGRPADAVPMAEEALALATDLGATDLLPHISHVLEEAKSRLW